MVHILGQTPDHKTQWTGEELTARLTKICDTVYDAVHAQDLRFHLFIKPLGSPQLASAGTILIPEMMQLIPKWLDLRRKAAALTGQVMQANGDPAPTSEPTLTEELGSLVERQAVGPFMRQHPEATPEVYAAALIGAAATLLMVAGKSAEEIGKYARDRALSVVPAVDALRAQIEASKNEQPT